MNTTYHIPLCGTQIDVVESTTDFTIRHQNQDIQVWREYKISLADYVLKTDKKCLTLQLADIGGEAFGPTGLTVTQAITVFEAIFSKLIAPLDEATDIIAPEMPADIGTSIESLKAQEASLQAGITVLQSDIGDAQGKLGQLVNSDIPAAQSTYDHLTEELTAKSTATLAAQEEAEAKLAALESRILVLQKDEADLNQAIKEKSEISTNLSLGITPSN